MAVFNKWLVLCAASLACYAPFGSCRRQGQGARAPPEPFIFNELCAMKDDPGPCKAIKDRFFFNVDTGNCELFEYGGCGGNANNFLTLEECEETCVVSDDKNPCHLAEAPGPCRGLVTRYFFDSKSQQCQHFFYGGCFGNANNFRSMAECQAKCQNPEISTEAPTAHFVSRRPRTDVMPLSVVNSETTISTPLAQINGTVEDNNNQELTPAELCFSPVDRGTCDGSEKRFAYSPRTKRCHMFSYSGCGGNKNNFTHRRHCIKKCIKSNRGVNMIRIRKKNINMLRSG